MANEGLRRTPTSTGNRKVWTWSGWIKRNKLGVLQFIINRAYLSGKNFQLDFNSDDYIEVSDYSGGYIIRLITSQQFRDISSWYHILLSINTTSSTTSDRAKLYVNGSRITDFSTETYPTINAQTQWNNNQRHEFGDITSSYDPSVELTDVFFVDGQSLTPDVFGFYKDGDGYMSSGTTKATDFRPGQWSPKAPKIIRSIINAKGEFGVNGFYLPMNDSSNPGADFHCAPNSIIKLKGENFDEYPQPQNGAPATSDAYVSELRDDPFAANLILACPFVAGGFGQDGAVSSTIPGLGDYHIALGGPSSVPAVNFLAGSKTQATITGDKGLYYGSSLDVSTSSISPRATVGKAFTPDGDYTIEFWCYISSFNSGGSHIIQYDQDNGATGWLISLDSGTFRWMLRNSSGQDVQINVSNVVKSEQWNHIAGVYDSSRNLMTGYLNGVAVGSTPVASNYLSTQYTNLNRIHIGSNSGNGSRPMQGYLQDLRIYKGVAKYKDGFDVPKPYTPVGIESWRTTADTCKNNFATWNAIDRGSLTLSDGNLSIEHSGSYGATRATIEIPTTGKWYYEHRESTARLSNVIGHLGLGGNDLTLDDNAFGNSFSGFYWGINGFMVAINGSNIASNWISPPGIGSGDILNIAYDADSRNIWLGINGTYYTISGTTATGNGNPTSGTNPTGTISATYSNLGIFPYCNAYNTISQTNFGQNPSFSGTTTAGTNADSNGKGLFKYAPPSGFLALCEDNLPTPAIADPGKHFKCVFYTGKGTNGSDGSQSIRKVGFQPDLVWVKKRDTSGDHKLIDSVRGSGLVLESNTQDKEGSETNNFTGFNFDGFDLGANNAGAWNESPHGYVAWCWKAGGPAVSNTDGSVTSQVSVNQTAGFSIVSYNGGGNASDTVGHGLSSSAKMIILKDRDENGNNWRVWHTSLDANNWMYLNLSNQQADAAADGGIRNVNNSTLGFVDGTSFGVEAVNTLNRKYIAYCWTEIEGYSKFGSYVGNQSTDGPFVYCGFKPAFIIRKSATSTVGWYLTDSSRNPTNPVALFLDASDSDPDGNGTDVDFLSNGFKLRNDDAGTNHSNTYIFAAFAESPFQTANAK